MRQAKSKWGTRSSGILLHITSLPGRYGIGDVGTEAFRWVDQLARANQSWWQILPLGPPGAGNSPYQCYSAFAGNTALISPDLLVRDALLRRADLPGKPNLPADRVDFDRATALKARMIDRAWERFGAGAAKPLRAEFDRFRAEQAGWLDDYALFMAIRERFGTTSWTQWPTALVRRDPTAMREAARALANMTGREAFAQFLFARQLAALKRYANERGVKLIGDVPIFVSLESADVWSRPELFQLDAHRRPKAVAGVPPDFFSATGQRWGNPLYDWRAMERDKFEWWVRRMRATIAQVDLARIDHFRGFAAYWRIAANASTAQNGRWVRAPGRALFQTLRKRLGGLPVIAEDLGVITPDVERLRDEFELPGMRVLQFAFGGESDNPYLPHNYVENAIAYTGTHDNDTTVGWYRAADATTRKSLAAYAPGAARDPAGAMMQLAWSSVARIAIAPVQDVLKLDSRCRFNVPGRAEGNWSWRMRDRAMTPKHLDRLAAMTATYGRAPPKG